MDGSSSISQWIAGLKAGEAEAAQRLWERYSERLTELARRRLRDVPKRGADEEDVVQSVFHALCRGASAGRFENIRDRDDVWWLLLKITRQKVIDHLRRETAKKRGSGRVQSEADLKAYLNHTHGFSLDDLIGQHPTPEWIAIFEEEHQRLLRLLRDDPLRRIATARIEGYTVAEIADDLAISTRSVERKLQLIRNQWAQELSHVS